MKKKSYKSEIYVVLLLIGIIFITFLFIKTFRPGIAQGVVNVLVGSPPSLITNPSINNTSPSTNSIINCTTGEYFDPGGNPKVKDYWRWYANLTLLPETNYVLNLSISGYGDDNDIITCSQIVYNGAFNSTWYNSSSVIVVGTCNSDWKCDKWRGCIYYRHLKGTFQRRECRDQNYCNSTGYKRYEYRDCWLDEGYAPSTTIRIEYPLPTVTTTIRIEQPLPQKIKDYTLIIVLISALIAVIIITIVAIYELRKKNEKG